MYLILEWHFQMNRLLALPPSTHILQVPYGPCSTSGHIGSKGQLGGRDLILNRAVVLCYVMAELLGGGHGASARENLDINIFFCCLEQDKAFRCGCVFLQWSVVNTFVYCLQALAKYVFALNSQLHADRSPFPATWLVKTNEKKKAKGKEEPYHPHFSSLPSDSRMVIQNVNYETRVKTECRIPRPASG